MPTATEVLDGLRDRFPSKYKRNAIRTYEYWAKVEHVVDGDTLDLYVDAGFDTIVFRRFRLLGVDTPEIHGVRKNSKEYAAGLKAVEFLRSMLPEDGWVEVKVSAGPREKFGRWLCEVFVKGKSINEALIEKGWVYSE